MSSQCSEGGLDDAPPFLVRLFYRTGAFHRQEDFVGSSLPQHVSVYAWPTCTLRQLAMELADSSPSALPSPAAGTRLAFQLVFPDLRKTNSVPNGPPRYGVKDMGSIVVGGIPDGESGPLDGGVGGTDEDKSLGDARFVVGDYVSCAVLPPLDDGSIAPVSLARPDPGPALRDGRSEHRGFGFQSRDSFRRGVGPRGGRGNRRESNDLGGGSFPEGEWRRGEQLPHGRPIRGRGRGRW